MYFKLALKNVKKSFKDYAVYFFTLIVGVSIFYMFNSMDSQTIMLNLSDTKHDMLDTMNEALGIMSIFVAFVLAFLIIYASRFLMKRRKKEFGIYMLLGMKKKKISKIILTETLFVGIISLIVGLGIGIGLSQLMSVVVANMFEADMTKFSFTFSKVALGKTILYFTVIYIVVMIFNVISVNMCKLIDLINSSKKTEKVKLKNMALCIIIFLIAATMLGYAYYNVTANKGANIDTEGKFILMIVLGIVSTFLLFWSLSGMLLKIAISMKKMYYKGVNSFVVKQLSSQVNTTVFSMSIICLMLFVTICIFSTAMSLKDSMNKKVNELAPVDINLNSYLANNSAGKVEEVLARNNIDMNKTFKDIVLMNDYTMEQVKLENILKNVKEEVLKENPSMSHSLEGEETLIKISDYNKVAKLLGKEIFLLAENEYIIISDQEYMTGVYNKALEIGTTLTINGKEYKPKYSEVKDINLSLDENYTNFGTIILPDTALEGAKKGTNKVYANYKANTKEEKQNIEKEMVKLQDEMTKRNEYSFYILTREQIADESIGFGAMVVFIGLYLGIVFLISSGAILALKELSESNDNKERYDILRKIGTDEKTINKALFKQIGIFFLFPLILAIIHSIPGINVATTMIESLGKGNLLTSVLITAGFLILIYGGYFLISYYSSKRIIREK